ncbi:hypothetical protein P8452_70854 [Trifolium repens]|nr:hypothetical protein P8452_70854 [Trifolium repens]
MGTNIGGSDEAIYQEMVENEVKVPVGQKAKSHSLVVKKASPITPKEVEYVEQYELGQNPEHSNFIEGDGSGIDINLPDLDRTQLEPSTLLDILNKKSSFHGSFISIPEVRARNKVLKHCGLPDDEYLVLFTPSYKDAIMLVGESYPFFKGNYYMTILGAEEDYIKEFAFYKDAKVISAPDTWLDLSIGGSQLSQNFRRRCKISPKGLFAYAADVNAKNALGF